MTYYRVFLLLLFIVFPLTSIFGQVEDSSLIPLNINYPYKSYYLVQKAKVIGANSHVFPENKLSIVINHAKQAAFQGKNLGRKIYIANRSKHYFLFPAQDNQLFMCVQALNPENKWEDIEYIRPADCGNSYCVLMLYGNEYWTFVMPVYSGDYKTKLRVCLAYTYDFHPIFSKLLEGEIANMESFPTLIYSKSFEGSINLGQFMKK